MSAVNQDIIERLTRLETQQQNTDKQIADMRLDVKDIKVSIADLVDPIHSLRTRQQTLEAMILQDRSNIKDVEIKVTEIATGLSIQKGSIKVADWVLKWIGPTGLAIIITAMAKS